MFKWYMAILVVKDGYQIALPTYESLAIVMSWSKKYKNFHCHKLQILVTHDNVPMMQETLLETHMFTM